MSASNASSLANSAEIAKPALIRLAKAWLPRLADYIELTNKKRETASAATAADNAHKAAKGALLRELGLAKAATCGGYVVSVTESKAAEPSITLATGEKHAWDKVTKVLIGNQWYDAAGAKLYGGRSGSVDVNVSGG